MRDRLIELMRKAEDEVQKTLKEKISLDLTEWLGIYADYLIANGVFVPTSKVGEKSIFISLTAKWKRLLLSAK